MATLVSFHAHPDDECIGCGGVLRKAFENGHRTVLVVATKGEHGEVPDGFLNDGETLADRRVAETEAAAEILGVQRVEFLGYVDSGMMGTPTNTAPGSFWTAPVEEAARRLAEILRAERADVLTVYDDNGGYGHPDHIQVHRVGMRAGRLAGTPRVYQNTMNRDQVKRGVAALAEQSPGVDFPDLGDDFGKPESMITAAVDVTSYVDHKRQAMKAHASQISEQSFFLAMPDEAFRFAFGTEWFIRDGQGPGITETDLLAGLSGDRMSGGETRDGVELTNLDQPLFDGADATKRDLVDYLDAVHDRIIPGLADRPLSVIRVRVGQEPFMQKNVPKYTPSWIQTIKLWAAASKREVSYALCNDRRTLLWLANQRAVEYHPTLFRLDQWDSPTHIVLDLDPPPGAPFTQVVGAAHLIRQALADAGLAGAVKTSGAKGVHIFVPVDQTNAEDAAAASRAIAARAERLDPDLATTAYVKEDRGGKVFLDSTRSGGGTVVAAYSPRVRPGVPVSFPVAWADLDQVTPADFTLRTAPGLIGDGNPWAEALPEPQRLPEDLLEEGRAIPIARVAAMHEGKRRARAARRAGGDT